MRWPIMLKVVDQRIAPGLTWISLYNDNLLSSETSGFAHVSIVPFKISCIY
jgi:hypothetical protein